MPIYTELSSETFRHPLDRQAEETLRSVLGFDLVAQSFVEYLYERPYIVLNTGLIDLLTEEESRTVIAHELGHIKCDHTTLIQMAIWATGAASLLGELTLGVGNLMSSGLIYAFYEWKRKAELSVDRVALLVMNYISILLATMMKLV